MLPETADNHGVRPGTEGKKAACSYDPRHGEYRERLLARLREILARLDDRVQQERRREKNRIRGQLYRSPAADGR